MCGWRNKLVSKRRRCHNMVDGSEGRWYCTQVPHSHWRNEAAKRWFSGPPPGYQAAQGSERGAAIRDDRLPPLTRQQAHDCSEHELTQDLLSVAVRAAQEVTNDSGWRREALRRASTAMGDNLYKKSKSQSVSELCSELNGVATELLKGGEVAKKLASGASEEVIRILFPRYPLAAFIGKAFAGCIMKPLSVKLEATAQALRAYGVSICATQGELSTCPCLRAIIKPIIEKHVEDMVREAVGRGLELLHV